MKFVDRVRDFFTPTPIETKTSRVAAMTARLNLGRPVWPQVDYRYLIQEAWAKNVIVNAAIRKLADAAAAAPILLQSRTAAGRDWIDVKSGSLHSLLARPNPQTTWRQFVRQAVCSYQVTGNVFFEAVAEGVTSSAKRENGTPVREFDTTMAHAPVELYIWQTQRTKIVPSADGFPAAYEYDVNGIRRRFAVQPIRSAIWQWRAVSLGATSAGDWYGESPLLAAMRSVEVFNEERNYAKSLLQNQAVPSGFLTTAEDRRLSDTQYAKLKQELSEQYQGASNAGKPMLLEGGLTWQPSGISPRDLELQTIGDTAARQIALALGVPPQLLGIPGDSTYSNFQEANYAFARNTVLPTVNDLLEELLLWLEPWFSTGNTRYRLIVDEDAIHAISTDRTQLWQRVEASTVLTTNEKREAMGFEALPGAEHDEVLVDAGKTPLRAAIQIDEEDDDHEHDEGRVQ